MASILVIGDHPLRPDMPVIVGQNPAFAGVVVQKLVQFCVESIKRTSELNANFGFKTPEVL
jgi:hypothetical protein